MCWAHAGENWWMRIRHLSTVEIKLVGRVDVLKRRIENQLDNGSCRTMNNQPSSSDRVMLLLSWQNNTAKNAKGINRKWIPACVHRCWPLAEDGEPLPASLERNRMCGFVSSTWTTTSYWSSSCWKLFIVPIACAQWKGRPKPRHCGVSYAKNFASCCSGRIKRCEDLVFRVVKNVAISLGIELSLNCPPH